MRTYRTAVWRSLPIDRAELASYYENTLIGTSISNPNFAPQMWNQHEATQMMIQCSSNIPEGWHHGFHSMLSCSKPTIWKFLDRLKAKPALTDVKKTQKRRAGTTWATCTQMDALWSTTILRIVDHNVLAPDTYLTTNFSGLLGKLQKVPEPQTRRSPSEARQSILG